MGEKGPPMTVCLYSKYSEQCVVFFQDMAYLKGIKMLCIDNEAVRDMVDNDVCHYGISHVPCVLVFFRSGRMDKYEGEDAFAWLYDRKQKMIMSSKLVMSAVDTLSSSVEPTDRQIPSAQLPAKRLEVRNMNPALPENPFPPAPPGGPPVEMNEELERTPGDPIAVDVPESERFATEGSKNNILKKKESIMTLAMSMAKQRESEFEANDPKKRAQDAGVLQPV
jgi:hypothetical protein